MSTLFEPSPSDLEVYTAGDGSESAGNGDSDTNAGFGCDPMGETETETETGFSVLGTGQYSRVVCAKRKQPWARAGRNVCAIKVRLLIVILSALWWR